MSIKFIQLPVCKIAEFVSSTATEFDVSGFLYNDGVTPVDPADIGDVCFATIEPKTAREELISFTINSVTSGGVATITAVRGLSQKSPYGTGGAAFDHQNGSDLVISNNPGLFNKLAVKANDETVTGSWQFPEVPSHNNNPVTKKYFDDTGVKLTGNQTVAGIKTFSSSPILPASTADTQAIRHDQVVRLADNQTIAGIKTFSSSPIVPTATTATQAVNKAQVESYIAANSGDVKASDSAFGTVKLSKEPADPANPIALGVNDPINESKRAVDPTDDEGKVVKLEADGKISEEFVNTKIVRRIYNVADSPATWTKPTGLKQVKVEAWGGGGGGGRGDASNGGAGGGGGGYFEAWFSESELGSPITVTVGAGGNGATSAGNGSVGGNSTFGTLLTAYGGAGGAGNAVSPLGGNGGDVQAGSTIFRGAGALNAGGVGILWGGGGGSGSNGNSKGGDALFGGAGGSGATSAQSAAGGTSLRGGNGGAGGLDANATVGAVPAGGGGGANDGNGANGGAGRVIVTEYY